MKALENGERAVRVQQDRATISVSETATSVGSLAVNDNLQDYHPADYELDWLDALQQAPLPNRFSVNSLARDKGAESQVHNEK